MADVVDSSAPRTAARRVVAGRPLVLCGALACWFGCGCLACWLGAAWPAVVRADDTGKEWDQKVQAVIDEVDATCRQQTVYMIGPERAKRLAELVRRKKPRLVVECGTALGYSGLWIARELKVAGKGKLITIEIDPERAKQARATFEKAGLADVVDVRVGDARRLVGKVEGPVDFAFIDCNYSNYFPCFRGLEDALAPGAVVVADNVGIGAGGMKDYLDYVRGKYPSETEWFDIDLPWGKRDAMEVTVIGKRGEGKEDKPR